MIVDKNTGEEETSDSTEAKANKDGVVKENKTPTNSSSKNSSSNSNSNKNDSNKNESSSGNKDTGAKPSEPSKPVHTHSWVAVTEPVYETECFEVEKCYGCGKTFQGGIGSHIDEDPFDKCSNWGSDMGSKQVYAGEKIVGYKCDCGTTK